MVCVARQRVSGQPAGPVTARPAGEAMDADGSALLIIRAWVEPRSDEPLRAQLRMTGDVSLGIERTVTFARADDVCDAVRDWLAAVVRDAGRPEP